jgi:hypothetical protein
MASPRIYRPSDDPWTIPVLITRTMAELPRGYANRSARTVLRPRSTF